MSPVPTDVDVLVVGADHLGLTTAIGLAESGITVQVLDVAPETPVPWTEVHHWSVLPGLSRAGLLDDLLEVGAPLATWGLRVLQTAEQLTFNLGELGGELAQPFHLRIDEGALRATLVDRLLTIPGASIRRGRVRQLSDCGDRVLVEVDDGSSAAATAASPGHVLCARWVVGSDGVSSPVRREAGIGFEGVTWRERCVIAVVEHDFAGDAYADVTLQIDPHRGAVVERMGPTTWRYVFVEEPDLPEEEIGDRLPANLAAVTGAHPVVLQWTAERMHERCATTHRRGRVLLIGAAAHVTHRMIGHSSISGWYDALSLAPILAAVVRGGSSVELDAWAAARRRIFLDEALPASLSRNNLVTQLRDPSRLLVELEEFRRAQIDPVARRELLMLTGGSVADGMPDPSGGAPRFRTPERRLPTVPAGS